MAKKRPYRVYTDAEKSDALAALAANGGNVKRTADELGIPERTLNHWSRGKVHAKIVKLGEEKRLPLADVLESIAYKLAEAVPAKIPDATLQQTMTSLGIAIDKMRLLREQPTEITDGALSDEERAARTAALLDLARARRAGQTPPPGTPVDPVRGAADPGVSEPR